MQCKADKRKKKIKANNSRRIFVHIKVEFSACTLIQLLKIHCNAYIYIYFLYYCFMGFSPRPMDTCITFFDKDHERYKMFLKKDNVKNVSCILYFSS